MHEEVSIPELTAVVARLSALLGPRQGGVLLLEGGITNRNYRVNFGGTPYVVRLPGKDTDLLGIDREGERLATRAAAELELGPKVAAMLDEPPCLVTCFVESREVTSAELREPARTEEVARGLRAFHESGLDLPTQLAVPRVAARYAEAARARGGDVPATFDDALDVANRIAKAVEGHPEHEPVPCHNDLLTANFLHGGEKLVLVDWEYAGMGDRFFDLGGFAVNNELGDADEERMLEAYFGEPATDRRRAALKLFRFVSDLREAIWGVLQTTVSELDFDFGGYADKHFKRLKAAGADERFGAWIREAAGR